jgi:hypothetical protein
MSSVRTVALDGGEYFNLTDEQRAGQAIEEFRVLGGDVKAVRRHFRWRIARLRRERDAYDRLVASRGQVRAAIARDLNIATARRRAAAKGTPDGHLHHQIPPLHLPRPARAPANFEEILRDLRSSDPKVREHRILASLHEGKSAVLPLPKYILHGDVQLLAIRRWLGPMIIREICAKFVAPLAPAMYDKRYQVKPRRREDALRDAAVRADMYSLTADMFLAFFPLYSAGTVAQRYFATADPRRAATVDRVRMIMKAARRRRRSKRSTD